MSKKYNLKDVKIAIAEGKFSRKETNNNNILTERHLGTFLPFRSLGSIFDS